MTLADRLTTLRERRGWSMGQLAGYSGVSRPAISRIEAGLTPSPGAETLAKLAAALRVEVSDITGERPMPRRQIQVFEGGAAVPVMRGRVHAGGESYWDDTSDTVYVSRSLQASYPRIMAAVVDGDCMTPHIQPGDKVVFDPDRAPVNGQMVVVVTDDGETLLKWYRIDEQGQPFLRSADGDVIRPNGARVVGVVIERHSGAIRDPET